MVVWRNSKEKTVTGVCPFGKGGYRTATVIHRENKPVSIVSRVLLDSAGDIAESRDTLAHARPNDTVVLSIPRSECLVKMLRIPTSDPDQIATMMAFEASGHLPWPPEDSLWAYQILDTDEDGYTRLLLSMVEQRVLEVHLANLRAMKIEPTFVETSATSLSRIVRNGNDEERPAILFVDGEEITYVRLHKGQHAYSRGVKSGETLEEMIEKCFDVDARHHGPKGKCTSLILADGSERGTELPAIVGDVPVVPLQETRLPGLNGIGDIAPGDAMCLGAALANGELLATSNLLPAREQRVLRRRRTIRTVLISATLVLWFVGIVVTFSYIAFTREVSRAQRATTAIANLGDEVLTLKEKSETLALLADERRNVSVPLTVVLELYDRTPQTIAITSFRYDSRGPLAFGGEAPSFHSVYTFLDSLLESERLVHVEMNYGTKPHEGKTDGYVDFKVSCFVKGID
jgi:hypothetical protein